MKMVEISGRSLCFILGLSFAGGVLLGYKIKSWRLKYLQAKRDYLAHRLRDTQKKIDVTATS